MAKRNKCGSCEFAQRGMLTTAMKAVMSVVECHVNPPVFVSGISGLASRSWPVVDEKDAACRFYVEHIPEQEYPRPERKVSNE